VIDQRGGFGALGAGLDLVPEVDQEAQIGAQLFFRRAFGSGADDEAARGLAALADQDALQPLTLFVGLDLAADADVRDGGHEDQEPAGEGDVRGDARALLGDRLLGNLHQDLLAGLEQVRDDGQVGGLGGTARHAAALSIASTGGGRTAASSAASPSSAIPGARSVAAGSGCAFRGPFFLIRVFVVVIERLFHAVLVVEV
jgi:hypothetical protein